MNANSSKPRHHLGPGRDGDASSQCRLPSGLSGAFVLVRNVSSDWNSSSSQLMTDNERHFGNKMNADYKAEKEASVSLLSGGPIWEINHVTLVAPVRTAKRS